ncbi:MULTISPECIES: hypothetical protein [Actinoalloteichus]|uniref:Uncharacterized protein n=1 Tax=Actinoalloteichus fjordicus TaxID=1612552 RepID=A0AAC9LCJ9_9PSEU|nr:MULTISPECIES: hypothetical protein [Actinoalloteichus]APU15343.1 hypothetical protein UA74_16565 [Actinoalloteichus fjordicus]APU21410.1 hypothetical protein UA75_17100 [Actinoalloteichus sp. GBA129-24]
MTNEILSATAATGAEVDVVVTACVRPAPGAKPRRLDFVAADHSRENIDPVRNPATEDGAEWNTRRSNA